MKKHAGPARFHLASFLAQAAWLFLSRLRDFAAFDAAGADPHAHVSPLRTLDADRLQVRIEAARGAIIRMRDIVTELRAFAADFASFGHDCLSTS